MSKIDVNSKEQIAEIYQWAIQKADECNEVLRSIRLAHNHCCLNCLNYGHPFIKVESEGARGIFEIYVCSDCGMVHRKAAMKKGKR